MDAASPVSSPAMPSKTARLSSLRNLDLRSIPSSEFSSLTMESLRAEAPAEFFKSEEETGHSDFSARLFTAAGERHYFRCWNFLKYSTRKMLTQLRRFPDRSAALDQVEKLWEEAQAARDQIVRSNLRLVIRLAHQYAPSASDVDDFISEGNLILLNAIDKFDYTRGYRFSTYATHAVSRHYFRLLLRRRNRTKREIPVASENLRNVSAPIAEEPRFSPQVARELIRRFNDCLNPRERTILEQRFGLRGESSATLKMVAGSVGLSKERVRQLQQAALDKLQTLATELRLHPETCL